MDKVLLLLVIVLIVVIVVRGPKTLPQIGQMLGRGVKEARKEAAEIKTEMRKDDPAAPVAPAEPPPPAPPAPGAPGSGASGPA